MGDNGIVLWSLSGLGDEFRGAETLMNLCTIRDYAIPAACPTAGDDVVACVSFICCAGSSLWNAAERTCRRALN